MVLDVVYNHTFHSACLTLVGTLWCWTWSTTTPSTPRAMVPRPPASACLTRCWNSVVLDVVYNHTFHSARDGAPPARLRMFDS